MQPRSQETRLQLMEAALRLFSQHGYQAASVADICAAAGASKGAFYYHFASKQAIFLALMEAWLADLDANFQQAYRDNPDIPAALLQMSRIAGQVFQAADVNIAILLEFWIQSQRDPLLWQAAVAPYHRYQQYFAELIQSGIQSGAFQPVDPATASRLLVAAALGLLMQGLFDPHGADWAVEIENSIRLLVEGFACTPA